MDGKTVIVVGVGKGSTVGYGVARAFAQAHSNVVVVGRSKARLKELTHELEGLGVQVLPQRVEAVSCKSADEVVENTLERFGRIDVVVNAMQVAASGITLVNVSEQELQVAMQTGPMAVLAFMQACYPHLKQTQGTVINFASHAALRGQLGQGVLAVAKEGVRALGRVAANEWKDDGITVVSVCALARTTQLERWHREFPKAYAAVLADVPGKRFASIDEVGKLCVLLARSELAKISGNTYLVDGTGIATVL